MSMQNSPGLVGNTALSISTYDSIIVLQITERRECLGIVSTEGSVHPSGDPVGISMYSYKQKMISLTLSDFLSH